MPGFGLFQDPNQISQQATGTLSPALNLASQAAQGVGPSAAGVQQQIGLNQAMQRQAALANSTRGSFGLANAQRMAQTSGAQAQQQAVNEAAMRRAQEQEAARGQYLSGAGTLAGLQNQAQMQAANANQQTSSGLLTGGANALGGAAMMFSDARLKQPTPYPDQSGTHLAQSFLDHLMPRSFNWKDPHDAPNPGAATGTNLGVYAQDIEKTPMGKTMVQDTPQGKTLDLHALTGALAAGAGYLAHKKDEHEMRIARLEQALGMHGMGQHG